MKKMLTAALLFTAAIATHTTAGVSTAAALDIPMGVWNDQETAAAKSLMNEALKARGREVSRAADFLIDKIEAAEQAALKASQEKAAAPPPAPEKK